MFRSKEPVVGLAVTARAARASLLALSVLLGLGACSIEILHDLDEEQANEVLAALQRQGIAGAKQRSTQGTKATYAVSIPRAAAPQAWGILRQQNLPRQRHKGFGDVFGDQSLVPTPTQERARMRQAVAGELARTLESLEGVRKARVHVVLPTKRALGDDGPPPPPRAAVLLQLVGKRAAISAPEVKKIVAGSVERLTAEAVEVVIVPGAGEAGAAKAGVATVSVGPFQVAPGSRAGLLATLVLAVLVICALALAVLLQVRRRRRSGAGIDAPVSSSSMGLTGGRHSAPGRNATGQDYAGQDYVTQGSRSILATGARGTGADRSVPSAGLHRTDV